MKNPLGREDLERFLALLPDEPSELVRKDAEHTVPRPLPSLSLHSVALGYARWYGAVALVVTVAVAAMMAISTPFGSLLQMMGTWVAVPATVVL